jgi:hypothetical protein
MDQGYREFLKVVLPVSCFALIFWGYSIQGLPGAIAGAVGDIVGLEISRRWIL